MAKRYKGITRRDFIKSTSAAALGVATLGVPAFSDETETALKSKVVLIRNKDVVGADGNISGEIVQKMLDEAVVNLYGKKDVVACWKKIIAPTDIVGINNACPQ